VIFNFIDLLHEKALILVKNYKRSEKELLDVLCEIDRAKGYLKFGVSSLYQYCVRHLGLSESETYRFIQVTRKAEEVPQLKSALSQGLLTVSQASRIASVVKKDNASLWIEKTLSLTQREIEREVSKVHPKVIPHETLRALSENRTELRLSVSVEFEKKLRRAQEVLRKSNLEETLEVALDLIIKAKDPVAKAQRFQEKVEKKNATVSEREAKVLPPSRKVAKEVARQVRQPLPASLVHQVSLRDRGQCTFRGCKETHWVEIHHIKLLSHGGSNSLSNLTTLCSAHHKYLHDTHLKPFGEKSNQL
jgi:hypothetical protein